MPPTTRSRAAADATKHDATMTGATPDGVRVPESTSPVIADAEAASSATPAAGSLDTRAPEVADLVRSVGHAATLPVKVMMAVAEDIASTARRPDAVLYWGGLAGLAALGIFEWPVAAAVGVGVAVANGRRSRPQQPTPQPTT